MTAPSINHQAKAAQFPPIDRPVNKEQNTNNSKSSSQDVALAALKTSTFPQSGEKTWEITCLRNKLKVLEQKKETIERSYSALITQIREEKEKKTAPILEQMAYYEKLCLQKTEEFEEKSVHLLTQSYVNVPKEELKPEPPKPKRGWLDFLWNR